ncbi:MAG TPA: hypothetical protein VHC20_04590 [Candidatus Paceibacterota bacterium]|nr:hypothetical protein [Candidatus Paceibacterota bacterium]
MSVTPRSQLLAPVGDAVTRPQEARGFIQIGPLAYRSEKGSLLLDYGFLEPVVGAGTAAQFANCHAAHVAAYFPHAVAFHFAIFRVFVMALAREQPRLAHAMREAQSLSRGSGAHLWLEAVRTHAERLAKGPEAIATRATRLDAFQSTVQALSAGGFVAAFDRSEMPRISRWSFAQPAALIAREAVLRARGRPDENAPQPDEGAK